MAERPPSDPMRREPQYLAVVRHGRDEVFQFLQHFEASNLTEVVWDRRTGERRAAERDALPERRATQRRALTSAPWDALGFVLAPRGNSDEDLTLAEAARADAPAPRRPRNLCVVRHGHTDVFLTMQDHFRDDPGVQVIWDRRTAERRARLQAVLRERRGRDRRLP